MNVHSLATYHETNHIPIPLKFPPIQGDLSVECINLLNRFSQLVFDYSSYFPKQKETFIHTFYEENNTVRFVKTGRQLSQTQTAVFKVIKSLFEHSMIQKECSNQESNNTSTYLTQNLSHTNPDDQELLSLANYGSNLENLTLHGGHFTAQGLAHLLQQCPSLTALEFYHNNSTNFDDYLIVVALYAPQLERLTIIDCQLTDHALLAFSICKHHLRSFECWDSSGQGALTDYGFSHFISQSELLEAVKLTGFPLVSQFPILLLEDYTSGRKKKSEAIKELTFAYCGFCDVGLFEAIVASFCNLESLEIGLSPPNRSIDESTLTKQNTFVAIAQACPRLRRVKLSDCCYLDSQTIERFLNHSKTIEQLELYRCTSDTSTLLSAITKCPLLKSFHIEPNTPSTIPFSFLLHASKQLETLSLNHCLIEEIHLVEALKTTQPKFKHLRLFNCGHFSNQLLETLGTHCSELTLLEIEQSSDAKHSSMYLLNDTGVKALSTGCQKLETLNLKSSSPSWQFTDASLATLSNCQRLAHLTLSHFNVNLSESTSNTIDLFNRRCIHLTHLGFPFSHITDESITPLFTQHAKQLRSIDLKQVTGKIDLLKDLVIACPNLQVLEIDHAHMKKGYIQKLQNLSQLTVIYTKQLSSKTSNPSLSSSPTLFSAWKKAAFK